MLYFTLCLNVRSEAIDKVFSLSTATFSRDRAQRLPQRKQFIFSSILLSCHSSQWRYSVKAPTQLFTFKRGNSTKCSHQWTLAPVINIQIQGGLWRNSAGIDKVPVNTDHSLAHNWTAFLQRQPFSNYNASLQAATVQVQESQWSLMRRGPLNLPLHPHWYWGLPANLFVQAVCCVLLCVRVCARHWSCMTIVNDHLSITGTQVRDFQEPGLILSRTTCRETTWFFYSGGERHGRGRNLVAIHIQRPLFVDSQALDGGKNPDKKFPKTKKRKKNLSSQLFISA